MTNDNGTRILFFFWHSFYSKRVGSRNVYHIFFKNWGLRNEKLFSSRWTFELTSMIFNTVASVVIPSFIRSNRVVRWMVSTVSGVVAFSISTSSSVKPASAQRDVNNYITYLLTIWADLFFRTFVWKFNCFRWILARTNHSFAIQILIYTTLRYVLNNYWS